MIKLVLALLFLIPCAHAYVPTVESLFRNGSNPEITASTVTFGLKVTRVTPAGEHKPVEEAGLVGDKRLEDFYKIFLTKTQGDALKVSQTRYLNNSFSEASLEQKFYFPNFTAYTIKSGQEQVEKGIFFGLLRSLTMNNGHHLVSYLKTLGAPVRLNEEILNHEKIEYLAAYKRYLIAVNRDRKKNEVNPLRPDDPTLREKVESVMKESLYVDTNQVKLTRDNGEMAWMITAGPLEAVVSYDKRQVQWIRYKSQAGEFEITCQDYWLANGTHFMPKRMLVKNFSGELYQVDIGSFRHINEKEDDLVKRLQKWDQILKGRDSATPRPEFLL